MLTLSKVLLISYSVIAVLLFFSHAINLLLPSYLRNPPFQFATPPEKIGSNCLTYGENVLVRTRDFIFRDAQRRIVGMVKRA